MLAGSQDLLDSLLHLLLLMTSRWTTIEVEIVRNFFWGIIQQDLQSDRVLQRAWMCCTCR